MRSRLCLEGSCLVLEFAFQNFCALFSELLEFFERAKFLSRRIWKPAAARSRPKLAVGFLSKLELNSADKVELDSTPILLCLGLIGSGLSLTLLAFALSPLAFFRLEKPSFLNQKSACLEILWKISAHELRFGNDRACRRDNFWGLCLAWCGCCSVLALCLSALYFLKKI